MSYYQPYIYIEALEPHLIDRVLIPNYPFNIKADLPQPKEDYIKGQYPQVYL